MASSKNSSIFAFRAKAFCKYNSYRTRLPEQLEPDGLTLRRHLGWMKPEKEWPINRQASWCGARIASPRASALRALRAVLLQPH